MAVDFTKPFQHKSYKKDIHDIGSESFAPKKYKKKSKPIVLILMFFVIGIAGFIILATLSIGQKTIKTEIFYDDFSSNSNEWMVIQNEKIKLSIDDGKYTIQHLSENRSWMVWTDDLNIDNNKDFDIEVVVQKIANEVNYGFGLYYGGKNVNLFHIFAISENGYFKKYHYDGSNFINDIDWQESSYINKGSAKNKLRISIKKDKIHYFINGNKVASLARHKFYGNRFGFRVDNVQKITFDDFKIYYVTTKSRMDIILENLNNI